jgi:O-antigen ligase
LISIFVYFPTLYENVFAKLNTNNKDYLSSLSRIASFLVPIEIIKESPIFGVGLTDFVKYYETLSTRVVGYTMKADSTSTNTFLNLFAIFGIIYGGIIIKYYYHFCKLVLNKSAFLLLIIIFIMFSSQDLRYSLLFLTLLSYGIIAKYNKRTQ